ncbi:hypothetical protein HYH03_002786 [Edaphochlamys debaryana]|uniref:Uncharacterized protein n=1 Tax=Edaphochlamys debaryana TaxID=47281 RepID=A0A835YIF6_9CHLO|nr:hypothetical protein HYH03_002786 [Edaphochlamys debaryana]|eukprot:KAG2499205.1 hypothetical protein HYH03_002786 [Edaphochlamys debaryana]
MTGLTGALTGSANGGPKGVVSSGRRPTLLAALGGAVWSLEQAVEDLLVGWTPNKIPDLSGRLALVTGGNSGIGLEIVRKLAENCATVLMVTRDTWGRGGWTGGSRERGEAAAEQVRSGLGPGCPGRVEVLVADLISLKEVDSLISQVRKRVAEHNKGAPSGGRGGKQAAAAGEAPGAFIPGLSMLCCNAALFQPGGHAVSPDGIEQTLAVDYFSHVALTLGLLDELEQAAPFARIVWQSSQAEQFGSLDLADLKGARFTDSGMAPYGAAKLWALMFCDELQRRLRARGGRAAQVEVFGVHPGLVDSPLMDKADTQRHWNAALIVLQASGNCVLGMPTWRGALPALYSLTEPKLTGRGFSYFGPSWTNTHMLGQRSPGNSLWRTGGEELRCRLFDASVAMLEELGHGPKHVPKPAPATYAATHTGVSGGTEAAAAAAKGAAAAVAAH